MRPIVCVLKSGGFRPRPGVSMSYGPQHVQWLAGQFVRHVGPRRFVCLSDVDVPGVETIPLRDNLPGWWSKIEIFREFLDAFYVDLDTVIVEDVSAYIDAEHRFTASAGVYIRGAGQINSSMICWSGDYRWLYERFIADKDRIMAEYVTNSKWGDQGFIRDAMREAGKPIDTMQRMFPEAVVSFTRDVLKRRCSLKGVEGDRVRLSANWTETPRFVLFNGRSKPWNVRASWIPRLHECA